MSLWALTLEDFRSELASRAPTPGGGAAACVCGSFGLALVSMALEISRPAKAPGPPALSALLERAQALAAGINAGADGDVAAFSQYMSALKLPRASPEEQSARQAALGRAALVAAEVPLAVARDMVAALELSVQAAALVKPALASDVLGGADLLAGAVAAVLRNVDINLPALESEEQRQALSAERAALAAQALAAQARVVQALAAAGGAVGG
jgi:formiminotetrahydrofolate cyclodeaminase